MASENPGKQISLLATSDFTVAGAQYAFAIVDANGQATLAGAGAKAVGVVQNKPAVGQGASVMVDGVSQVVAGGVIAAGAFVKSGALGVAVSGIANAGADALLGIALEAAVANQIIKVKLGYFGQI
jgi:hypothetical protein